MPRPAIVAIQLTMSTQPTMSVGVAAPIADLNAMMVIGTRVVPVVHKTKKVHIAGVAFFFSLFKVCNCCMAFIPKGVAAFPRPSIFAPRTCNYGHNNRTKRRMVSWNARKNQSQ